MGLLVGLLGTRPRCATGNGSDDAKEAQSPGRCRKARGVTRFGRRSKRRLRTARGRNGPDAAKVRSRWSILVRVFGRVCGPRVERGAFFGRKMRAVFGRVKTSISKELCKTMSHRGTVPSAASDARKSGFAHGRACGDRARAGRTGPRGEDFGGHGGVVDFCVRGAVRDEGIGTSGGGRGGKGRGTGNGGFGGGGGPWVFY